jgi:hypothetical protein
MRTAPRGGRRSSARRYLHAPATYASSSNMLACRHSTALKPTWVRQWHVSSRPTLRPRMMRLWLTSGSPQPWWKKRARHPSPQHLHRADICVVDLIDLRIASSHHPGGSQPAPANAAQGDDLRVNLDNNRHDRDARSYIDQCHRECEERELLRRLDYDREYAPGNCPLHHGA